jgi:hypothetical protein
LDLEWNSGILSNSFEKTLKGLNATTTIMKLAQTSCSAQVFKDVPKWAMTVKTWWLFRWRRVEEWGSRYKWWNDIKLF